jgi:hypothetical protein
LPAFAGVALSFVTVEWVLHLIEVTPAWRVLPIVEREPGWPDPDTGYALRPGQAIINVREQRAKVTTNSVGMRDRERRIEKPAATFRVAVTGDSFTEALQVADDRTFTRRAERLLNTNDAGAQFEVLNFGMSGAGPVQQLVRARIAAATFTPDALVMLVNVNLLQPRLMSDDALAPAYVRGADGAFALGYRFRERRSQRLRNGFAGQLFFTLMDHSRIARAAYLAVLHRGAAAAPTNPARTVRAACPQVRARIHQFEQLWEKSANDRANAVLGVWMRAVEELATARGMPVALVLMGLGAPRVDCPAATMARAALLELIRGHVTAVGFHVHDGDAGAARIAQDAGITEPLSGFGRALGSGHLNDYGHRVYAQLLGEIVAELTRPTSAGVNQAGAR